MKGARSLQPGTSKTRTHTSITAMRRSLLDRKTSTVAWQHREKTPSSPPNPMPSTMSRVSRNGTVSGTDSNLPCSKHIPKSMGISSVVFVSTKILYECRSPRPTMYPTIELTATLRVYLRDYQQGSIDFNALISVFLQMVSFVLQPRVEPFSGIRGHLKKHSTHHRVEVARNLQSRYDFKTAVLPPIAALQTTHPKSPVERHVYLTVVPEPIGISRNLHRLVFAGFRSKTANCCHVRSGSSLSPVLRSVSRMCRGGPAASTANKNITKRLRVLHPFHDSRTW